MLKSLRRKFILIAMGSVTAVLALIIGVINTANYRSVVNIAGERLALIELGGGFFPELDFFRLPGRGFGGRLNEDAVFDTRYFTVTVNSSGTITAINTGWIAAVDADTAGEMALSLWSKNKTEGFLSNYRYKADAVYGGTRYIFLDCGRELETFFSFFTASCLVSALGLILVFLLVLIFSKIALRPVEESLQKQKRFITDASHEIKTPLAVISAANEVIALESGESEWTKSIDKQIKRLTSLTEKLVFLSRMDEESYKPTVAPFDLSKAVEETALSFEAVAQVRNRALTLDVQEGIRYAGDEGNIRQLTSLLVDNALKYSDEGGYIHLHLTKSGRNAVFTVENSVEEIEKGDLSILFERFYRADTSRSSKTGGQGIGLSVAQAIVWAHKGKITAHSPDGKRVIFTVTL